MAQLCVPWKDEDLSLIPNTHLKASHSAISYARAGEAQAGSSLELEG